VLLWAFENDFAAGLAGATVSLLQALCVCFCGAAAAWLYISSMLQCAKAPVWSFQPALCP